MTQTPRDWKKDMDFILREKERVLIFHLPTNGEDIAIYWLQEAKERGEREQRLKEEIETALRLFDMGESDMVYPILESILTTLYPDTPAPKEGGDTDWIHEDTCARCGRNKPVEGYEWCSECRPELKVEEGDN